MFKGLFHRALQGVSIVDRSIGINSNTHSHNTEAERSAMDQHEG